MQKQTVLIFGQPSDTSRAWMDAFQQRGLKVVSTASPSDVERVWRESAPMLTVMDASVPPSEALRLCRNLRGLASAPILLILASASDLTEAYRAGATECLVQPATPAVILLKALAWSVRGRLVDVHPSHEWTPSGSFFQGGLNNITV